MEPQVGKSSYRPKKFYAPTCLTHYAACVSAPNRFGLMLDDVVNYNDITSTSAHTNTFYRCIDK